MPEQTPPATLTSLTSVQLYTVRRQLADDPAGTLKRLADQGFVNVEPFDPLGSGAAALPLLKDLGLNAPSMHARMPDLETARAVFEQASAVGTGIVIDPMIPAENWADEAGIDAVAARLAALIEPAAEHGITIGYHNHWWELEQHVGGVHALEALAQRLDPRIVLEVDTYWAQVGGADVVALLGRLGDRVKLLHVKDGAVVRDPLAQTAVGSGQMDVVAVLQAAPAAIRVVELDDFDGDVFDALRDSLGWLAQNVGLGPDGSPE